jgi:hypothetical protein
MCGIREETLYLKQPVDGHQHPCRLERFDDKIPGSDAQGVEHHFLLAYRRNDYHPCTGIEIDYAFEYLDTVQFGAW